MWHRDNNQRIIYLLRHGKTQANVDKLYCGSTDLPLLPGDASGLHPIHIKTHPEAEVRFFTSGMARTNQTLQQLFGTVDYVEIPALREFDFGAFEMQSYEMLKDTPPYQRWIMDEVGDVSCPSGDSRNRFKARVMAGWENILETTAADVAVVICHGGVIATIMEELFPNQKHFYEWQPKPGRGWVIEIDGIHRKILQSC